MRFIGIWYNMKSEIKRDYVTANNAEEASNKIYALYAGRKQPGPCLSVVPESGRYGSGGVIGGDTRGGSYGD